MRIRRSTKPPPYWNRTDQRRLLYLLGLLVLVFVAARFAARPQTWSWMFRGSSPQEAQKTDHKSSDAKTGQKRELPLKSGEFRATAKSPGKTVAKTAEPPQKLAPPVKLDGKTIRLDPALFTDMKDGELGIQASELQAYRAILKHVAQVSQDELKKNARTDASFTVMRNSPDDFRGSVITIVGRLGSLKPLDEPVEDLGLKKLYEAWIVTPQSKGLPYRVIISELPEGLEPKDLFKNPPEVRVTGYFFKVQKYYVDKERLKPSKRAPVLLARRIELVPPNEAVSQGLKLAPYVVGFALIVAIGLAITIWRFTKGDKKFAAEHLQRYEKKSSGDVSDLNSISAGETADEYFERLTAEEDSDRPG